MYTSAHRKGTAEIAISRNSSWKRERQHEQQEQQQVQQQEQQQHQHQQQQQHQHRPRLLKACRLAAHHSRAQVKTN